MGGFEYLADGHHVDDAGNLIACTYVDFRDPVERYPVTVLRKVMAKRHAIPGCETIRISKPACFLDQGEGIARGGEAHYGTNGWIYCASIEPETAEDQAAWRSSMPAGCDAVSKCCQRQRPSENERGPNGGTSKIRACPAGSDVGFLQGRRAESVVPKAGGPGDPVLASPSQ